MVSILERRVSIILGDKRYEIAKVSEERRFETLEDLDKIITRNTWSPYLFKDTHPQDERYKHRVAKGMTEAHVFAIDIDGGLTLDTAKSRLQQFGLRAIVGTSKSHQKEKNGTTCDRFRIVFPLQTPIKGQKEVLALFFQLQKLFPEMDPACKDAARLFYPCKEIIYIEVSNELLTLTEKGDHEELSSSVPALLEAVDKYPLSRKTMEFLLNGAPEGQRNTPFTAACHDAIQQNWTLYDFLTLISNESPHEWMLSAEYELKAEERFKNFVPSHPPRVPSIKKAESSEGGDPNKTRSLPLARIKEAVHGWLERNNVAVSYNQTLYIGNQALASTDITRKLIVSFADMNYGVNGIVLEAYLQEWINERRMMHLEAVRLDLGDYRPEAGEAELRRFMGVLKGEFSDLDVATFKHMLWQVKRKLNGFKTKYEMMLVLTGGQGAGKSTALKDFLFSPLGDLAYTAADFQALSDQREGRLFSDHYVILFDEMAGAQRSDMERTKQIITARVFKQRVMGTTAHSFLPINATFFGTSNKRLEALIKDDTGMRRFGEFVVDNKFLTQRRWHILKDLDYKLIWACVDANAERAPIEDAMDELHSKQEEMRDRGVVEWLLEEGMVAPTDKPEEFTSSVTLALAVSVAMGSSWSSKRLASEWARAGIKTVRTSEGVKYAAKVTDKDIVSTLRNKYNVKVGNTDGGAYGF